MKRVIRITAWISLLALLAAVAGFLYLTMTTSGARIIAQFLMSRYISADKKIIREVSGHMAEGVTLKNARFVNIEQLPEGSELLIQQLDLNINGFSIDDVYLNIDNARLDLPLSDPVVLFATLKDSRLDANVFSPSLVVEEILAYLGNENLRHLRGRVDEADVYVEGRIDKFVTRGKFKVVKLSHQTLQALDTPGEFRIEWTKAGKEYQPEGVVKFFSGKLKARHIQLDLAESRVIFDKEIKNPRLDLRATTVIENVKISITLRGSRVRPDLQLSSLPPLPEEQLILMVVTGKRWKSLETSLQNQQASPALAKDVVEFLFFSGEAGKVTEKLGIRDINVQLEEGRRGVGGMIGVTENIGVGYQVTETENQGVTAVEHRLQGEVGLSENLSLTLDKELPNKDEQNLTEAETRADDKIQLKYKMKF